MYEKELQEKIRWLNSSAGRNINISTLANEFFIEQPEYFEIKELFLRTEYKARDWKWHQIVRMVLEPPEVRKYIYDRLLSLLLKHRRSFQDYFTLKTREGVYSIPNTLSDLNRLEILYNKYFQIYQNIKSHIHFEQQQIQYSGSVIKGHINWDKTIRSSTSELPVVFVSSVRQKEFETPENILLILGAEWMFRESKKLYQTTFDEPLTEDKKNILRLVIRGTGEILDNFPFASVLNNSRKFWDLGYSDSRIIELEEKTRNRLRQKLVRNQSYAELLGWISDFKNLDISRITTKTLARHILDSIENLDTVYEAWIFLEFVDFLHEKGMLINFNLGERPSCQFEHNGMTITFWYERTFEQRRGHAWALEHRPDFTAMFGDEILAVFDAKNYSERNSIKETQNKMLAYMLNLDANFGGLIYPNHPKSWEELNSEERTQKIIRYLMEKSPKLSRSSRRTVARRLTDLERSQLPEEYRGLFKTYDKYEYPAINQRARYHFDQTLCLLRMPPAPSPSNIEMKNESLSLILNEIIKRIPNS